MATSLGLNALALRLVTRNVLPLPAVTAVRYQHRFVPTSHDTTHVKNFRRTQAEIKKALTRKQNFLHPDVVEKHRHSPLQKGTENVSVETEVTAPRNYRFVMPEFMPWPEWDKRDKVLEKLERRDMLRRRAVINIPEFYVGSIMEVVVADSFAPNKQNRFVGICIDRGYTGLRAYFILRNVVDGLGVEVMYHMYSPTILSIRTLKLEKRLDDCLYYLRDALIEYSEFPFDMEPVVLPRGSEVPVNTLKVKMKPRVDWIWKWEYWIPSLHGIQPVTDISERRQRRADRLPRRDFQIYRQNDLMVQYRSKVPDNEEEEVMAEVYKEKQAIDSKRKVVRTVYKKRK